jgi:CRISPR-associated protein (TIGR03986 family)
MNRPYVSSGHNAGNPRASSGRGPAGNSLDKITAPYNFVPLSRKVFFPDWAGHVSHDLPFEDGISGELICELTTHTPIYVRNGGKWAHEDIMTDPEAQSFFCLAKGTERQFIIPGSTLKGMVRNVIEISAFGKMNKVDNHRFALRDLTNSNKALYIDHMTETLASGAYKAKAKAAWLCLNNEDDTWNLIPCQGARVEQDALIAVHPHNPTGIKKRISAQQKYELWGKDLSMDFSHDGEKDHKHSCGALNYIKAQNVGSGNITGTLVLTGQPAENKRPDDPHNRSKHMEFIFFNEEDKMISVSGTVRDEFQFIHSDSNGNPNEEWDYWKEKFQKGKRIPVFYLTNKDGSLHSMGLALMYRLPYAHSVHEVIRHTSPDHFHNEPDLAETIFGFVDGKHDALKGRVAFSPAVATKAEPGRLETTVLGAPKPTFYPNYIEQPARIDKYKTFMDPASRIRGWKRYPTRPIEAIDIPPGVADKVNTKFVPLRENAKFDFRVKLHNLRPMELGAVAWALTWGNNRILRHSLGMGKSLGHGQVTVEITNSSDIDWKSAIKEFVDFMDGEVGRGWEKTAQMEQLLAMANPQHPPQCGSLTPLLLKPNQFVRAKKERLALLPHKLPTAQKDEDRFKNLSPRTAGSELAKHSNKKPDVVKPAASGSRSTSTIDMKWPNAFLSYNPGSGRIVTAVFEGKKATLKLTEETKQVIAPEIFKRLMKKKEAKGTVSVEPIGGNCYVIINIIDQ